MPKYLAIQRNIDSNDVSESQASPAQMKAIYAKFGAWREQFSDHFVDLGGKLGQSALITHDDQPDGPFVELKELIGGYMILSASDLTQATDIASSCPGLVRPGSGVEVFEIHAP